VNQIKKMKDLTNQKKSAQLLLSKIKESGKSKKDYGQNFWFIELEKLTK